MRVELERNDRVRLYEYFDPSKIDDKSRTLDMRLGKLPEDIFLKVKDIFDKVSTTPVNDLMLEKRNFARYTVEVGLSSTWEGLPIEVPMPTKLLTESFKLESFNKITVFEELYNTLLPYADERDLKYKY